MPWHTTAIAPSTTINRALSAPSPTPQASGLKFEAEATGWLQKNGVPLTADGAKYGSADAAATVKAILSPAGFVQTTAGAEGPFGFVLDATSFYAESGGQVRRNASRVTLASVRYLILLLICMRCCDDTLLKSRILLRLATPYR